MPLTKAERRLAKQELADGKELLRAVRKVLGGNWALAVPERTAEKLRGKRRPRSYGFLVGQVKVIPVQGDAEIVRDVIRQYPYDNELALIPRREPDGEITVLVAGCSDTTNRAELFTKYTTYCKALERELNR